MTPDVEAVLREHIVRGYYCTCGAEVNSVEGHLTPLVMAVVAPALEAAERKITMQREVIDTGQRVEYGQVRHIAAIEHELAEAQAELEAAQAENERLRKRIHEAVDECQRRYAPDLKDLARFRNVRDHARRHYDEHADKPWAYISEIQRAYISDLTAERNAARAAVERVRALCDESDRLLPGSVPSPGYLATWQVRAALDGEPGDKEEA